MVWLFSILAFSNIAMGYGLAIYFQRLYGTAMPACPTLRIKKSKASTATSGDEQVAAVSSFVVSEKIEAEVAESKVSVPTTTGRAPSPLPAKEIGPTVPAEEVGELPPVDEENVLAGIEEFRSQLAKMNVASEDVPSVAAEEVESKLVDTAN